MNVVVGDHDPTFAIVPYAESVTPGHPDIACNIASDRVLDDAIRASLKVGGKPRVAFEVTAKGGVEAKGENLQGFTDIAKRMMEKHGEVMVTGEMTLPRGASLSIRSSIVEGFGMAGYRDRTYSFSPQKETVFVAVNRQSSDIAKGVDPGGAGDQGAMVGFATSETDERMPRALLIAREVTKRQFELFSTNALKGAIKPDGKSQVFLRQQVVKHIPVTRMIENLTVAVSHSKKLTLPEVRAIVTTHMIEPVLEKYDVAMDASTQLVVNGAGPWTVYGPTADAGTTNRKLIAQSYGLAARHGGGGWSGKDPTKVDRSGALFARHIAVSLVAAKIVGACEVVVSYSIGVPTPHVIHVHTFGTNARGWSDRRIRALVADNFSWSVAEMIETLKLWQPFYAKSNITEVFGVPEYPWEIPTELR